MKHAFLIMAHKNFNQLTKLLQLLDNPEVEVFLHIDTKSPKYEVPIFKYSKVKEIKREKINWGGYSLINCEIRLLEEALKNKEIEYFHLLTGQDLPLVNIKGILHFFEKNKGKNFIHFDRKIKSMERYERIKYYRLLQELAGRNRNLFSILQNRIILPIQKLLKIDRTKKYETIEFKSGSQFFSITRELAEYVINNEKNIKEWFSFTTCGDEMFIQTLVYNSKFKETLYNTRFNDSCFANQRYIDWNSGSPYTWRISDFQDLKESNCLFARKFDEEIDSSIIEKIIESIQK